MSQPRRPRNRRPELPYAIELLIAGREREIENTKENRWSLAQAIWFRAFDNILDETGRQRALKVLGELRRPEEEARYQAELAMHAEWIRQREQR